MNIRRVLVVKATCPPPRCPGSSARPPGPKVWTTSVWDRLDDGYYVTDYYVATPSKTSFSRAIARC